MGVWTIMPCNPITSYLNVVQTLLPIQHNLFSDLQVLDLNMEHL